MNHIVREDGFFLGVGILKNRFFAFCPNFNKIVFMMCLNSLADEEGVQCIRVFLAREDSPQAGAIPQVIDDEVKLQAKEPADRKFTVRCHARKDFMPCDPIILTDRNGSCIHKGNPGKRP